MMTTLLGFVFFLFLVGGFVFTFAVVDAGGLHVTRWWRRRKNRSRR